jgi:hypothetical protein
MTLSAVLQMGTLPGPAVGAGRTPRCVPGARLHRRGPLGTAPRWSPRAPPLSRVRCGPVGGHELSALHRRRPAVQPAGRPRGLCPAASPGGAAAQPRGARRCASRAGLQHGGELRHQHQLAGLRWRDHHELPDADARPGCAELRVGGHRHGRAGGADSRPDARVGAGHRELLGRSHALHRLRAAAALARPRALARVAGRGADVRRIGDGRAAGPHGRRGG